MKILFLAPQPFFEARGTPINVKLVNIALSELGHSVDLVVFPHGEDVYIPNVSIRRVAKIPGLPKAPPGPSLVKFVNDGLMFLKAARMLAFGKYDGIHGVEECGVMAWLLSKIFRVPYIFDMDSHITDQLRYSGFMKDGVLLKTVEWMESSALKGARGVITVCPALTEIAKRYVHDSRVYQVEDIPQELPTPPEGLTPGKLRAQLGVPEGAPVALYTGNLEKYQGIDLILDATPHVAESVPDVRFVVAGGGARLAALKARAEELGVAEHIVFAGPRPPREMPVFQDMADVLLSPRMEGTNTPLKIYTYLKSGKPIVATALPTHTQLLSKEVAMLAKPEKMEYASAILLLLKDRDMGRALGERGRAFVEKNFNYDIFKGKIESAYKSLL